MPLELGAGANRPVTAASSSEDEEARQQRPPTTPPPCPATSPPGTGMPADPLAISSGTQVIAEAEPPPDDAAIQVKKNKSYMIHA